MKTTRHTKIRLEKHELKFVHFGRDARIFCQNCQTETTHLTIAQAANALGVSEKNIFRLAESEQVHSTETAEGQLLICAVSATNCEK